MGDNGIYRGWGLRNRIGGAIKRRVMGFGKSSEQRQVDRLTQSVSMEIRRLDLHHEEGLADLATIMAGNILESLVGDQSGVTALPFHGHLCGVITEFLQAERLFELPDVSGASVSGAGSKMPRSRLWQAEDELRKLERQLGDFDEVINRLAIMFLAAVVQLKKGFPGLLDPVTEEVFAHRFNVPLSMVVNTLPEIAETILQLPFVPDLLDDGTTEQTRRRLEHNLILASGGIPGDERSIPRTPRLPTKSSLINNPEELIKLYLEGTAFQSLFDYSVSIHLPQAARFEHHHIVAGTGHGKTQTLQHMILGDLAAVAEGKASIIVLDSQGDLIGNIAGLSLFDTDGPLADRLVVIDPTDVEYPVALNLFDVGIERIKSYSQLDRERMINGVLELYDFVLGSLLDAQMTQKQSVIFRYITRLMLHIPDATIATFRELLGEGGSDKYRFHINCLTGSARDFFETEFDSREFVQTKKQVLRRLWGILENQSFERMFLHPKSKLDLYSEMNAGKVILINTAKDLLKEEGTEFFGRFFIAMIAQAAQERSVIPEHQRMPTFVYIDEAADYFDRNIGIILSQARKYKVGMVLAHQFLGQLDSKLQEGVFANTSIRFAGGVSSKDARVLAAEMRTDASFIEAQDKLQLAAFIRGTTKQAISINAAYGEMESLPHMGEAGLKAQRDRMRELYAVRYSDIGAQAKHQSEDSEDSFDNEDDDDRYSDEPGDWN